MAKAAVKHGARRAVKHGTQSVADKGTSLVKHDDGDSPSALALGLARTAVKKLADRALETGGQAMRTTVDARFSRRPPVQVSVDVAVPLTFAWEEWVTFDSLTEGVHRIEDVERDGECLFGTIDGSRSREWVAEIVDEREEESFAWRSVEGSDCAGLVTFHRLSERLTRIEVDLDVLPTRPSDAFALATGLARRRADAELRRFKARVEFISPDVYAPELSENGDQPSTEADN